MTKELKKVIRAIKYNTKHGIDIRTTLCNLGYWEVDSAKRVIELIKDNTELMDKCKKLEAQIEKLKDSAISVLLDEWCKGDDPCPHLMKRDMQLIEATELIRNIIRVTWGEGWSYSLDWKVKAEQFLKEVEK